jgi:hypothetical protein
MKNKKTGGRIKGTPNKKTEHFFELCDKHDHDPVEFNILVAKNDWEALGYEKPTITCYTKSGDSYEQDRITVTDRMQANNKLLEFMYPKRKAIEISNSDESDKGTFTLNYSRGSLQQAQQKKSKNETTEDV